MLITTLVTSLTKKGQKDNFTLDGRISQPFVIHQSSEICLKLPYMHVIMMGQVYAASYRRKTVCMTCCHGNKQGMNTLQWEMVFINLKHAGLLHIEISTELCTRSSIVCQMLSWRTKN